MASVGSVVDNSYSARIWVDWVVKLGSRVLGKRQGSQQSPKPEAMSLKVGIQNISRAVATGMLWKPIKTRAELQESGLFLLGSWRGFVDVADSPRGGIVSGG